jgi:hypothetical protein
LVLFLDQFLLEKEPSKLEGIGEEIGTDLLPNLDDSLGRVER